MALRAVPDHPKFAHFKSLLGLTKGQALGYLECVWHFCGRYTPHGNIGKYPDAAIEAWVEWDGEPGVLVAALLEARWLDADAVHRLMVHDWAKHADDATKLAVKRSNEPFYVPCRDSVTTVSGLPEPEPEPVPEPETPLTPRGGKAHAGLNGMVPESLESIRPLIDEFVAHRKHMGKAKALTPEAIRRQILRFERWGPVVARAQIEQCIERGWMAPIDPEVSSEDDRAAMIERLNKEFST